MKANVVQIYTGSDGDATAALYHKLQTLGPSGLVAMNLFRAQKCSERAKKYRGRGFRDEAYGRKEWSIENLCQVLEKHAAELGISWGWQKDPAQEFFPWVVYIDTSAGQVSFHSRTRGKGPDYAGKWDGAKNAGPLRVVTFTNSVLKTVGIEEIEYARGDRFTANRPDDPRPGGGQNATGDAVSPKRQDGRGGKEEELRKAGQGSVPSHDNLRLAPELFPLGTDPNSLRVRD